VLLFVMVFTRSCSCAYTVCGVNSEMYARSESLCRTQRYYKFTTENSPEIINSYPSTSVGLCKWMIRIVYSLKTRMGPIVQYEKMTILGSVSTYFHFNDYIEIAFIEAFINIINTSMHDQWYSLVNFEQYRIQLSWFQKNMFVVQI